MFARKYLSMFLMLVLGITVFTGCSEDDEVMAPAPSTSKVLVTHASPDAPGVDILVDNASSCNKSYISQIVLHMQS
ncbi:MAG: DUF4397 domain-containing protein [Ignavibacteriales bacterium]|nr:DUF4397 domain-containing protein [Ignavibacteriales bacterium]